MVSAWICLWVSYCSTIACHAHFWTLGVIFYHSFLSSFHCIASDNWSRTLQYSPANVPVSTIISNFPTRARKGPLH
ncbi:hypothetical protein BJX62DRAFT_3650 [Aspergillus germanicus]